MSRPVGCFLWCLMIETPIWSARQAFGKVRDWHPFSDVNFSHETNELNILFKGQMKEPMSNQYEANTYIFHQSLPARDINHQCLRTRQWDQIYLGINWEIIIYIFEYMYICIYVKSNTWCRYYAAIYNIKMRTAEQVTWHTPVQVHVLFWVWDQPVRDVVAL